MSQDGGNSGGSQGGGTPGGRKFSKRTRKSVGPGSARPDGQGENRPGAAQFLDPLVATPAQRPLCAARARAEGYRGRAAFKIMELDDKFRFLINGARVVDLGCAPGGWAQVAVPRINALGEKSGKRIGTYPWH